MALPLVPILKLVALGSIKFIFLLFGIAFFPVFALRFILGGATSLLLPTLDWLEENERLDPDRHKAIISDLNEMSNIQFSRKESRHLLAKLIIKMLNDLSQSIKSIPLRVRQFVSKLVA